MNPSWQTIMLMIALTLVPEVSLHNLKNDLRKASYFIHKREPELLPHVMNEEYVRQIHSMINAYSNRGDIGERLVIETNALVNTKYRTWKRNADLINSLLALPKGMNDAGR